MIRSTIEPRGAKDDEQFQFYLFAVALGKDDEQLGVLSESSLRVFRTARNKEDTRTSLIGMAAVAQALLLRKMVEWERARATVGA